jgi:hypothetical protein
MTFAAICEVLRDHTARAHAPSTTASVSACAASCFVARVRASQEEKTASCMASYGALGPHIHRGALLACCVLCTSGWWLRLAVGLELKRVEDDRGAKRKGSRGGSAGEGALGTFMCRKGGAGTHIGGGASGRARGNGNGWRENPDIPAEAKKKRRRRRLQKHKGLESGGSSVACCLLLCCTPTHPPPGSSSHSPCADVTPGARAAASVALVARNAKLASAGLASAAVAGTAPPTQRETSA